MKIPSKFKLPFGIDWTLIIPAILLSAFGIMIIFSVTYSSNPYLMISQIIFVVIGLVVILALTIFDYRNIRGLSTILYIILLLLLILVLVLGNRSFGASRWINLGIFQLQPSEIGKLIIVIFLAKIFADTKEFDWKKIIQIMLVVTLPTILILIQPDFGTAMVFFASLIILLMLAPIKKRILLIVLGCLILAAPIGWHFLKSYQKNRIYTFINPAADPYHSGYNVAQAKITVGSGGLFGNGIGQGSQIQLNFLPVAHSDFVFASSAEAIGFVGSTLLIAVLIFLNFRMINVAKLAKDAFGYYFAITWSMVFLFEVLVNIGMNIGIMPVTGIPLPFISSGGTSMLTNMAAIGILESIYIRHRRIGLSS